MSTSARGAWDSRRCVVENAEDKCIVQVYWERSKSKDEAARSEGEKEG